MATKLPRVIGLKELRGLRKSLRERPAPLVYFSDREFARLVEGATELKRRPARQVPLAAFDPWPGGGMVQGNCESPEGQICYGQWTVGPGGGGVYFGCRCRGVADGPEPPPSTTPCQLAIDSSPSRFTCVGECKPGFACRLGLYKEPNGRIVLDCRCTSIRFTSR
jgi:hypothetical protein